VHRAIEEQAARGPERLAIVEGVRSVTYRELNHRANCVARRLMESGLTRGSHALVRMPRSTDLAVVLLAVLKAGASYTWLDPGSRSDVTLPADFCIVRRSSAAQKHLALDLRACLTDSASRPSPNLPIVTRGCDIACVLPDHDGGPHVLVPHSTIAALPKIAPERVVEWQHDAGALELWGVLTSGATMSIAIGAPVTVAA